MKRILAMLAIVSFLGAGAAFADCGRCGASDKKCPKGETCSIKQGCPKHGADCGIDSPCPVTQKFFKKACFFMSNADEIGLSDAQLKEIKALKAAVKKQAIRDAAEWKVFEMDLAEKLSEDKVDAEAINAMIDQASQGMAASGKKSVEAYAKLKGILSADQMSKAKAVWKKKS